jgi:osmotically inducible protein OsmC
VKIDRKGSARWQGDIRNGRGAISTQSGALKDYPYGFGSRFEGTPGTNPEELLGAAHSGCFTMALSKQLGDSGFTAEELQTTATVTLEKDDAGFSITRVHLDLKASVPGVTVEEFQKLAGIAKANCPVSKLFNAEITLSATLL